MLTQVLIYKIYILSGVAKQKVADEGMDMLRDHWPFNEDELLRLCDLCFRWKAQSQENGVGREVLLVSSARFSIYNVTLSEKRVVIGL